MQITIAHALSQIPRQQWQSLVPSGYPFLQYDYLWALEHSGAVSRETGWQPHHLILGDPKTPETIIPCYQKYHSRGEYVFDWSWAQACAETGANYYPKLLCAIPFTPSPGPRWLSRHPLGVTEVTELLQQESERSLVLSWHLLFADKSDGQLTASISDGDHLASEHRLVRNDCQFHWHNHHYQSFDDFLNRLTSSKRKSIRKERQKMADQGVILTRTTGAEISSDQMERFYRFYQHTYFCRGQKPYLNQLFFDVLRERMADQLMLVDAWQDNTHQGAALFLFDETTLYGRWWGGNPAIDCLHFEACYYQGIEFAIENRLSRFDPGTQGEHKLIRGFEPVVTQSFHGLNHPPLKDALIRWTAQERQQVKAYQAGARQLLPYKRQEQTAQNNAR